MEWTLKDYRDYYGDQLSDLSDYDVAELVRKRYYPNEDPAKFYTDFGIDAGRGAFGRGLAKGIESIKGSVVEAVPAMVRSALGDEAGAKENLAQYQKRMAATEAANPTRVKDFTEIQGSGFLDTLDRLGSYAGESFGQAFPSLAMVMAGAVTGGAAAVPLGVARTAGQAAGALAASAPLNTAESFVGLSKDGQLRPGAALLTGAIKSALDALPAVQMLRRGAGELGEKSVQAATARLAEKLGVTIGKDVGLEGLTEAAQAAVDQTAQQIVGLADKFDFVQLVDNGLRGAIGAGPTAVIQGVRGRSADQQYVEEETRAQQEAQARLLAEVEAQNRARELPPEPEALRGGLSSQQLDARQNARLQNLPIPSEDGANQELAAELEAENRQVPARIDMPGVGLSPDQLAAQTREAQTPGQPFGGEGQNRGVDSNSAINTEPQFVVDSQGIAREVVSRPPEGIDSVIPPEASGRPAGFPPRPRGPVTDAQFEFQGQDLLPGPVRQIANMAKGAAEGVVEVAPGLAQDVQALLAAAEGAATQNQAKAETRAADAAAPQIDQATYAEIFRKKQTKASAGSILSKIQTEPTLIGVLNDKQGRLTGYVVEVNGQTYLDSGKQFKRDETAKSKPGFVAVRSAPQTVDIVNDTPEVALQKLLGGPEALQQQTPDILADTPDNAIDRILAEPAATPQARGAETKANTQAVAEAPEVVNAKADERRALAELTAAQAEYTKLSDQLKTATSKTRPQILEALKQAGVRRKNAEAAHIQAVENTQSREEQTRSNLGIEEEAQADSPIDDNAEIAVSDRDLADMAFDDQLPVIDAPIGDFAEQQGADKVQVEKLHTDLAAQLYDAVSALPVRFTADQLSNTGVPSDFLNRLERQNDGTYSREEALDYIAAAAEDQEGAPAPGQQPIYQPSNSPSAAALQVARKIDKDTILLFHPMDKWRGLASDQTAQINTKFDAEVQLYTAIHEVGGHALGHLGKLSPQEVSYVRSKVGQKRLKALVMQAFQDGHPTLGPAYANRKVLLDHMNQFGDMEVHALAVEAASWYVNQNKPIPNSPSWFGRMARTVVRAMGNILQYFKAGKLAEGLQQYGFDEVGYINDILSGKLGQRAKGSYPPVGAVTSPFAASLGYPERFVAERTQTIASLESGMKRAMAAGNYEFAAKLGGRIAQLQNELQAAPAPSKVDPALAESAKAEIEEASKKADLGEAATPFRLGKLLRNVATPSFIASQFKPLQPIWNIVQGRWIPRSIQLENDLKRAVDDMMAKANDKDHLSVIKLMEATNSAQATPTVNGDTVTFTVPKYADSGLEGAGLRHRLELSKPGETITLTGNAARLYKNLNAAMQDMQKARIASLIHRAGFKSDVDTTNAESFQRSIDALRGEIEASGLKQNEVAKRLGALAKAVELYNDQIEGYMPMVRSGDWTVRVIHDKPIDASQRPRMYMVKSEREARKLAETLKKENPKARISTYATQKLTQEDLGGVPTEDILDVAHTVLDSAISRKGTREETDRALEILGNAVKNLKLELSVNGLRARSLRRRDIAGHIMPGEEGVYLRNMVRPYLSQMATQIAYDSVANDINDELRKMSAAGQNDLFSYARNQMVDAYLEPEIGVARAKALAFAWTLGGNFSSAVINMTQLPILTIPHLAATHGYGRAASMVFKSFNEARKAADRVKFFSLRDGVLFDATRRWDGLTDDEWQVVQTALNTGLIDQGLATETSGLFTPEGVRSAKASKGFRAVSDAIQITGKLFGTVEQLNRASTLLASYRLAKQAPTAKLKTMMKRGYGGESNYAAFEGNLPAQYAASVVQETQGVFNKANRPAWQQGWMGVPTQFMQFPAFMLETIARTLVKDADGVRFIKTPEGQKLIGGMLGAIWFFGGAMALPMGESLDKILEKLTGVLKPLGVDGINLERSIRKTAADLAKMAGASEEGSKLFAEAVARGPFRMTGLDISRRVAVDIGILDTLFSTNPADFLGPFGSISVGSIQTAADYLKEGQDTLAVLQFVPVALRNLARADMLMGGVSAQAGAVPVGGGDIISRAGMPLMGDKNLTADDRTFGGMAQALGFTPTKVSRFRETSQQMREEATAKDDQRQRFVNQMADYLYFAQRAQEAGKQDEARYWSNAFERELDKTLKTDRRLDNPRDRMVRDATSFRSGIAQRLEQRRTGALGPAGVVRGKEGQYFAQRETSYLPR